LLNREKKKPTGIAGGFLEKIRLGKVGF